MEVTKEVLECLEKTRGGLVAVYSIADKTITALYRSSEMHEMCGVSCEDFEELVDGGAFNFVMSEDLPGFMVALGECVKLGRPTSYYCRVFHRTKGYEWVHAEIRSCGEAFDVSLIFVCYIAAAAEAEAYRVGDRNVLLVSSPHPLGSILSSDGADKGKAEGGSQSDEEGDSENPSDDTPLEGVEDHPPRGKAFQASTAYIVRD